MDMGSSVYTVLVLVYTSHTEEKKIWQTLGQLLGNSGVYFYGVALDFNSYFWSFVPDDYSVDECGIGLHVENKSYIIQLRIKSFNKCIFNIT